MYSQLGNTTLGFYLHRIPTESYQVEFCPGRDCHINRQCWTFGEKLLAVRIAKGVKGLKDVHDSIMVNYLSKRTDQELPPTSRPFSIGIYGSMETCSSRG